MQPYKQLEERYADITALDEIGALLNWDRAVMMPEAGLAQRTRQAQVLGLKAHALKTDPQIGEWIAKTDRKALDAWQRANLEVIERQYAHATAVSAELVAKNVAQSAKTEAVWRKARAAGDFRMVRDELARLLDVAREYAAAKAAKLKKPLYEAMMDGYAPHMTTDEVDVIFDDLAAFLPGFLTEVLAHQKEALPLKGPFPKDAQEKLGKQLCGLIGFGSEWSRLDTSTHPFSTGIGDDVRITTRYDEEDFISCLQAVIHEAGHGFYDRFTPQQWHHQPVGVSGNMGMAIHESQSLSLDMQLARSREYWEFMAPHAQKAFGQSGAEMGAENLYRLATKVERGFIRVEADEITYPAHVILRYRLEKRMIEGKLDVKDLPDAWNAEMKTLIGAVPPGDKLGCLQDIHWYCGAFGYFPAYALGAIIAAQLVDRMKRDVPGVFGQVRQGRFDAYTGWLRDNVQSKGCLYKPQELIEQATGSRLSVHSFKKHLTERYLEKAYEGQAPCSATSAPGEKRRA